MANGERERILDHLENDYTEPVRDPVWRHIHISRPLLRIAEQGVFQKLDRIRQLGPAYLVYPGATHTRRSHSLGVFHIAWRMIAILARKNRGIDLTLDGVKAFLCAALLHDIGHYPYAHSLKDLHLEAHESLAARLILGELAPVIRSHLEVEPEAVASIIEPAGRRSGEGDSAEPPTRGAVRYYRTLLSGVLDPDKLDYLNRDAYFCGVPYGVQDVDFILAEIAPHEEKGLSISPKGVTALESILFSKYLMYRTVYWHKTVRIATAMIKKAVALGLAEGAIRPEELYGLDDEEFFSAFNERRFPPFRLLGDVRRRALYKQVWRASFRDERPEHRRLEDIGARLEREREIAARLGGALGRRIGPECIVVDIPERVSFELDIPVIPAEGGGGPAAASVLEKIDRGAFPSTLRGISVSACRDPEVLAALGRMDMSACLGLGGEDRE